MTPRVGLTIDAIGRHLPPLRANDWWPAETVARWREVMVKAPAPELPEDARIRHALEAGARLRGDPFQGAVARPVMPDDMTTADMELLAAEHAFEQCDVARASVSVVIQHSSANAHVQPVNAYPVHARLGLRRDCQTFGIDADNDSFLVQLTLASALLATRPANEHALLLQSSQRTHLTDTTRPWSTLLGDGASAVLVSRASRTNLLAERHATVSSVEWPYSIGAGAERWWSAGVKIRPAEGGALKRHFGNALVEMITTLDAALADAGLGPDALDVVAAHQPDGATADAYRRAFPRALVPDTFARYTSLGACNVPLALDEARRHAGGRGLGLTGVSAGGIGNVISAMVIDWSTP